MTTRTMAKFTTLSALATPMFRSPWRILKTIVVVVTNLSNRYEVAEIDPAHDKISSSKDDEWNRKILEMLGDLVNRLRVRGGHDAVSRQPLPQPIEPGIVVTHVSTPRLW